MSRKETADQLHHNNAVAECESLARSLLKTPLRWTKTFDKIVDDDRNFQRFGSFAIYAEKVCGPVSFHPFNDIQRSTIISTFVPIQGNSKPEDDIDVRRIKASFYDYSRANRCTFLTGRRGTGKTFIMNYVLASEWEKFRENRIVIFRTDVLKLNKLNDRNRQEGVRPVTIDEYTQAHSYFIALRYGMMPIEGRSDPLLSVFQPAGFQTGFENFLIKCGSHETVGKLWASIVDYFRRTVLADDQRADQFSFQLARHVLREDPTTTQSLFGFFCKAIQHEGVFGGKQTTRVVGIVDGIDNVVRHHGNLTYDRLLLELNDICYDDDRPKRFDKMFLLMRNDTFHDFNDRNSALIVEPKTVAKPIVVRERPIEAVLARKIELVTEGTSQYAKLHMSNSGLEGTEFEKYKSGLAAYAKEILSRLGRSRRILGNSGKLPKSREQEAFDTVFNGNMRSLLKCICRGYDYIGRYAKTNDRDILLKNDRLKRQLIFEGSVLAGCRYFPSTFKYLDGRWCPNIFEWRSTVGRAEWHGLVMLRVLQAAAIVDQEFTISRLTDELCKIFRYPEGRVDDAIFASFEFGLVTYRGVNFPEKSISIEYSPDQVLGNPVIGLTPKGRMVMNLPFRIVQAMYFMSLGVKQDLKAAGKYARATYVHNPDNPVDARQFKEPLILSTISLLRHIRTSHDNEMENARREKISQVKYFELPSLKKVEQSVMHMIRSTPPKAIANLKNALDMSLDAGHARKS